MTAPVVKTIEVSCDATTAFETFTQKMTEWWPLDAHSVSAMDGKAARSVTLEPTIGGRLTEIGHDGTEHHWGTVELFEPGTRLTLLWHIQTPVEDATKVDIKFLPQANGGTRVELTHSGWEVLGDRADQMRDGYNGGWVNVFEVKFAAACAA